MPPDPMASLLDGWEEEEETPEVEEVVAAGPTPTESPEEEPEDEEEADDEEEDESGGADSGDEEDEVEEEGEEGEGEDGEQGDEESVSAEVDPEIAAYLAKYGGDVDIALKSAAQLQRLMGRRDEEKQALVERNAILERALAEAQAYSALGTPPLNEEQRAWVEGAAGSANPAAFVQQAIQAGEFGLARAVCSEWAHTNPFEAGRLGQIVDQREFQLAQNGDGQVAPEVTPDDVINAVTEAMPEVRPFMAQMAQVARQLGDDHPVVMEARSRNGAEAIRGVIGLYEIARASTAAVTETREEIKRKQRRDGDEIRRKGQVSSAANSPSPKETPRQRPIMPGLTLEELDTEFARS